MFFPTLHLELTQQWDGFHQAADLFHGTLRLAAFVAVAAQAVGPAHHPAAVGFGLLVKLLQEFGGHWEVVLTITEPDQCFLFPFISPPQKRDIFFAAPPITCFHALLAISRFMVNLQSFTNARTATAGSSEASTSMLSAGAWPASFSTILSRKKHLREQRGRD